MSNKLKTPKKQRVFRQDKEDNRKFMIILAIATVLLIVLMYYIFVG